MPPITALVPAYNEGPRIGRALDLLQNVPEIDEIIVINDCSTDDTASVVAKYAGVRLLDLPHNHGKTLAIRAGAAAAKHDRILMYDADILGVRPNYLDRLVRTAEGYDMVILDYGGEHWLLRQTKCIAANSGIRILPRRVLLEMDCRPTDRYQLETRINQYCLKQKLSIAILEGQGVHTPTKWHKFGFMEGVKREILAQKDIILVNGVFGIPALLWMWQRLDRRRV